MSDYGMVSQQNMNPYAVSVPGGISMTEDSRHSSGNVIAANEEARVVSEVKAQVLLAKQFPRNASECMERILQECQRPTLAEAAVYAFPRGREMVTGPSIRLAEVMARNWGNNTYGLEVLERRQNDNGAGSSVIRAFAWDLETNTYVKRQFEVKHWRSTREGGYPLTSDRDIYELEANMGSRRMRACILQMIPGDVTAAAIAACRKTSSSGLSEAMKDAEKRARLIQGTVNVYEKMGVSVGDLEEYLSARTDDWTADHMMRLKELKNSLDDGVSSLGDMFPHLATGERDSVITKAQVKELMALAKKSGKQGEISDAMKKVGIAKYADIPADQFESIKAMIESLMNETTPEAKKPELEDGNKDEPVGVKAEAELKASDYIPEAVRQEKLPWEQ